MTSDRWRLVERLYHGALEQPATERGAFLADACGDDGELRREVESLLDQASMPGFLDEPAVAVAAGAFANQRPSLVGQHIGVYQVHSLLGRGGMGEVYRAHDTRLGRDVALKLLPPGFTSDVDRLARFNREARLLASLNHPNIGTIHGFEESDASAGSEQQAVRALVLELVEGETLADRIARGPLPIAEALTIARQIADALGAAHDKGIVHRDLKPANIKITPDDAVKVLDFGLAKSDPGSASGAALANSPTLTVGATEAGIILGTAAYMSPEQARGRAVDKRTDVWAFGCVLYEMLTGQAAFAGDTVSDTIGAILHREPDLAALPAGLPPGVRTLLRRCLEKDVKKRKRDVGDARAEIDDALARSQPDPSSAVAAGPRSDARPWMAWVAAVAGVTAASVAWWPREPPWQNPLANATYTRFTNFIGAETDASISPDGRLVAFLSDQTGPFHVWLSQIGSSSFTDLTPKAGNLRINPAGNRNHGFTADGSQIWIMGYRDRRLQLLPLFGGGAFRTFLGPDAANVTYAPDGSQLAYSAHSNGDPLFVSDTSGAGPKQIFGDAPALHNHGPTWSADGWIYFVHGSAENGEMNVWRVRPTGGAGEAMTTGRIAVGSLAVLGPETVLYVGLGEDGSGPWLWALDVRTKTSRRISSGIEQYTSIAASTDGQTLVASVASPRTGLWSVPILDRVAETADVRPYGPAGLQALAPRQRGTALFYQSALGTGDGLWRFKDNQNVELWNVSQGALLEPSSVSPDGLMLAFTVGREGRRTLIVKDVDGGTPRRVADSITVRGTVDWSPDGRWLIAGGVDAAGQGGLFTIPVSGGEPVRILPELGIDPSWSSKGDLIVYTGPNVGGVVPLQAVRPTGERVELPLVQMMPTGRPRYLPDGSGVVYLQRTGWAPDLWLYEFATRTTRQLTRISHDSSQGRIQHFDVTPDRTIIFDRLAENSDIVLIARPPR